LLILTMLCRLDFTARDLVHPILTKGTLDDVDKFCEMMLAGKLPGRAVLKVSA
jgi:propanol-preferring alcohol dehydrogenase